MAGIQVAESTSSKKKGPKVVDHLRIHRAMDGGHVIEHHYTSYEHEPRSYKFGPHEAHRAAAHVARHAGLPMHGEQPEAEGAAGEEPEEEE